MEELFLLHLNNDPGAYGKKHPEWRVYTTPGRASAALNLAMANGQAVGGAIYNISAGALQLVEHRGNVNQVEGQAELF